MTTKYQLASGIFMWTGVERRSGRYGYVFAADSTYDDSVSVLVMRDEGISAAHQGKRVKLSATVREIRTSGHAGDRFLNLFPSTPEVGEEIVLGVGTFDIRVCPTDPKITEFGLVPADGREELWIDPRNLYRLHDQTVDFFIEETEEEFSPISDLANLTTPIDETKAISNGDGSLQFRTKKDTVSGIKAFPKVENLGNGMFALHPAKSQGNAGEEIEIELN